MFLLSCHSRAYPEIQNDNKADLFDLDCRVKPGNDGTQNKIVLKITGRRPMRNYNTMLHMKLNAAVSVFSIAAAFSVLLPPSFTSSALAAQPLLQIPPEQRGLLSIELPTDLRFFLVY